MPEIRIKILDKEWDEVTQEQMNEIVNVVMRITASKRVSIQKRESAMGIELRKMWRAIKDARSKQN